MQDILLYVNELKLMHFLTFYRVHTWAESIIYSWQQLFLE